jgi:hypothetical protein
MQSDLFSSMPTVSVHTNLQQGHDELVDLLSKLLKEAIQELPGKTTQETSHDQDQR